mmetsp:Transcript_17440/g.24623  ORF Transcript_17440/g.24623 Transcript_17440/m.24623 type:complete len:180 (+) Transcript_17440:1047-1586(+)|eukprot:CAMPEP_0184872858 /NCGR_PEP_ID=MMETSP0580-20130426/41523_1 /TAXON_ID=1118495 /ORGANISM="Dactyliosolen fragilissimus" /LENGTH=179 /DNA_ID=CAMNT_0027375705 /DNA_START=1027 /DNA_END=1566 /DNA_ORIENTATION=-
MSNDIKLYAQRNIIAMYTSASHLINISAPASLLHHKKLHPDDKKVRDEAYREEYMGLYEGLNAFEYITENEYNSLKHVLGQKLPSITISTIKQNSDGKPIRAKYRICALGNLDHHDWHQSETFAPVLNHMEMRLIISEAIKRKRTPKVLDFMQAFCQSILPSSENYVLMPPHAFLVISA